MAWCDVVVSKKLSECFDPVPRFLDFNVHRWRSDISNTCQRLEVPAIVSLFQDALIVQFAVFFFNALRFIVIAIRQFKDTKVHVLSFRMRGITASCCDTIEFIRGAIAALYVSRSIVIMI